MLVQFLMNNSTVVMRPGADRLTAHAWVAGLNPVGFLGIHGSWMCPDSISPVPQLLSDFSGGRLRQSRRVWQILPHTYRLGLSASPPQPAGV